MLFKGNFEYIIQAMADYNQMVYPWQLMLMAEMVFAMMILKVKKKVKNRMINLILSVAWLWSFIFYFLISLTEYTTVAYIYGFAFLLQSIFFMYEGFFRSDLSYDFNNIARHYTGFAMILLGLFIYPILGLGLGKDFQNTLMAGLPGPTIVITLGFLLMTVRRIPVYLLVIPVLWSLSQAMISFKIFRPEDIILYITVLVSVIWLFSQKKYEGVKKAPLE